MSRRSSSLVNNTANAIDREVYSQYDNIELLIENIAAIQVLAQTMPDIFANLSTILNISQNLDILNTKVTDIEQRVFQQAVAPTVAEGASDGDIWMDTTENVLKVYREYLPDIFRWETLLYNNEDTLNAGFF